METTISAETEEEAFDIVTENKSNLYVGFYWNKNIVTPKEETTTVTEA